MAILAMPYKWLVRSMEGKTMSECLGEQDPSMREAVYTLTYTFNVTVNVCLVQHWFAL